MAIQIYYVDPEKYACLIETQDSTVPAQVPAQKKLFFEEDDTTCFDKLKTLFETIKKNNNRVISINVFGGWSFSDNKTLDRTTARSLFTLFQAHGVLEANNKNAPSVMSHQNRPLFDKDQEVAIEAQTQPDGHLLLKAQTPESYTIKKSCWQYAKGPYTMLQPDGLIANSFILIGHHKSGNTHHQLMVSVVVEETDPNSLKDVLQKLLDENPALDITQWKFTFIGGWKMPDPTHCPSRKYLQCLKRILKEFEIPEASIDDTSYSFQKTPTIYSLKDLQDRITASSKTSSRVIQYAPRLEFGLAREDLRRIEKDAIHQMEKEGIKWLCCPNDDSLFSRVRAFNGKISLLPYTAKYTTKLTAPEKRLAWVKSTLKSANATLKLADDLLLLIGKEYINTNAINMCHKNSPKCATFYGVPSKDLRLTPLMDNQNRNADRRDEQHETFSMQYKKLSEEIDQKRKEKNPELKKAEITLKQAQQDYKAKNEILSKEYTTHCERGLDQPYTQSFQQARRKEEQAAETLKKAEEAIATITGPERQLTILKDETQSTLSKQLNSHGVVTPSKNLCLEPEPELHLNP